jgi:hypothetical protein
MPVVILGNVTAMTLSSANQIPYRIVVVERWSRDNLSEPNLAALFRDLQIGVLVDPQCRTDLDRNRHLTL